MIPLNHCACRLAADILNYYRMALPVSKCWGVTGDCGVPSGRCGCYLSRTVNAEFFYIALDAILAGPTRLSGAKWVNPNNVISMLKHSSYFL